MTGSLKENCNFLSGKRIRKTNTNEKQFPTQKIASFYIKSIRMLSDINENIL